VAHASVGIYICNPLDVTLEYSIGSSEQPNKYDEQRNSDSQSTTNGGGSREVLAQICVCGSSCTKGDVRRFPRS